MESEITAPENINFREKKEAISAEAEAGEQATVNANLSVAEKAAFGLASAFSIVILVICLMLTIMGFIFSPITDTLVFALLTGATGLTSWVIWRGGKCRRASS